MDTAMWKSPAHVQNSALQGMLTIGKFPEIEKWVVSKGYEEATGN